MNYSISGDTASGSVNLDKLTSEIIASGALSSFVGLMARGDVLTVEGTITDQTALDAVIHAHISVSLADLKAVKIEAIDARTRAIIAGGFTFDGHQFSLSTQAQTNWLGLISLQSLFTWPMGITDNADTTYALAQANVTPFVATGCGVIAAAIGSGRALKIACNAAADQAALDAVVDSR